MRFAPYLVLGLTLYLAACAQDAQNDLTFRGEIPVEGKLIYER